MASHKAFINPLLLAQCASTPLKGALDHASHMGKQETCPQTWVTFRSKSLLELRGEGRGPGKGNIRRPLAGNGISAKLGEGQSSLKVTRQTAVKAQGKSVCTWRKSISYLRLSVHVNLTFLPSKMDFSFFIEEPEHESLEEKKKKRKC